VWSGSPSSRAVTPSEMPDFPDYERSEYPKAGGWDANHLKEAEAGYKQPNFPPAMAEEKAEHIRTSCYFDDKPEEEEVHVDTAMAKLVTMRRPSRVDYMKI
jgi:hypothetical protein